MEVSKACCLAKESWEQRMDGEGAGEEVGVGQSLKGSLVKQKCLWCEEERVL